MKSLFFLLLLIVQPCLADDTDTDSWKHPEPIAYESLRAWHARGGLGKYHWPKEHKADLNGDGKDEVFLGISGFGRGMVYALFTERKGKWILLSEDVEGSHHSFEPIPGKNRPWRDFRSLQTNGRGGLSETIYAWNGKQYSTKSTREITAKELNGDGDHALGEPLSPDAKAAFHRGVARLNEQKKEVFNEDAMPALKPILDVQISSKVTPGDSKRASAGFVCVRIRTTKDSGHLKEFWFAFKDGKWVLTRSQRSPWSSEHPSKVSIMEDLSQPIQQKVKTCFELP